MIYANEGLVLVMLISEGNKMHGCMCEFEAGQKTFPT